MQRIVHGYADDGAADSQNDDGDACLEKRDEPQRKNRSGSGGNQYPDYVGKPFVAEPEQQADEDGGHSQGQERIFLDAGSIFHRHFRGSGGSDAKPGHIGHHRLLHFRQAGHQLCIVRTLRSAVGRIEKENAACPVLRKQAAFFHPDRRSGRAEALKHRREKLQRV